MVDFLLFTLASVGMTLILVQGRIFQPVRDFLAYRVNRIRSRREEKGLKPHFTVSEFLFELLSCAQCTGFWCGLFCGLFFITSDTNQVWIDLSNDPPRQIFNRILMLFCCGTASSFLSPLGAILLEWLFFSKMLLMRQFEDEEQRRAMPPDNHSENHEPENEL